MFYKVTSLKHRFLNICAYLSNFYFVRILMNIYFVIAAGLSHFAFLLHFFMGGREVARPLLNSNELSKTCQFTNYYCWHLVTISLALIAVVFSLHLYSPLSTDLILAVSTLMLLYGLWSLMMIVVHKLNPLQFGQWTVLVPIGVLGFCGVYLG